ncbi:hypothetical protein, partial [Xanthomonas axonopodis]
MSNTSRESTSTDHIFLIVATSTWWKIPPGIFTFETRAALPLLLLVDFEALFLAATVFLDGKFQALSP